MNSKILLFVVLGIVSLSFAGGPYLLVMDASGSMSDTTPPNYDETKMEAAKTAANNFIDQTSGEIALVVFDDCDAGGDINSGGIRLLQSFTTDKSALKSKVNSLEPYWDTPIADALTEAKAYLQSSKGTGTIILITDGQETCGGDPVTVAGGIYGQGVGTVHVIGYLIGGEAEETAMEIAEAGGGNYYSVENAVELEEALEDITGGGDIVCCPTTALLLLPFVGFFIKRRK
ncbi:VWA domain-containing protein [Candidatus Micrarchaeota archaeon]|nr:VWA domain-containing protein [Candidatus Micrarchaeota archaeon]